MIDRSMGSIFRRVDARNFHLEYGVFMSVARRWRGATVFVDTEFPGTIHHSTKPYSVLSAAERYALLKANVDELRPIQVGITICYTKEESLFGSSKQYCITWQFDLNDFDICSHPHALESVALLESAGINLDRTRRLGVCSFWLARLLADSGLLGPQSEATWVTFQGGYDIGILLKALLQFRIPSWLTKKPVMLPPTLEEFLQQTRSVFGSRIYDIKCLMENCGLHGGLERLAEQLMVKRDAGKAHQAGSDSLLTCHVFFRMRELYFSEDDDLPCRGLLFGLDDY